MDNEPTRWQEIEKSISELIRFFGRLAGIGLLVYCGWQLSEYHNFEKAAKAKAVEQEKDPEAAEFRNVKVLRLTSIQDSKSQLTVVCGEVNNKNQFGAYAGYRDFLVLTTAEAPSRLVLFDGLFSADYLVGVCNEINEHWHYSAGWRYFLIGDRKVLGR